VCGVAPIAALLIAGAAGCGDDDGSTTVATSTEPTPGTTSVSQQTVTTSTQPETTTTTTAEPAGGAASAVDAATAVLTTEGTAEQACDRYVTEDFIQTAYGGRENCIASRAKDALADGLALGPAIEEGATHLVVVPVGGPYYGAKVEVDVIRDGDTYRVDSLEAHVPAGP
jgi:hypothetical protein